MFTSGRQSTFLIIILATSLLLSACGRDRAQAEPDATPVPLRFIGLNINEADELLFEQFEEENPTLEFKIDTYAALPTTYITDDEPPDIMYMTPGVYLDSSIATGQVADLSDLWEQSNLGALYPPAVRELSERDGKQYFLPAGYSWTGLYYNRDVFDQFGLQPPTTWDELLIVADTLLANGITPFALAGQESWPTSLWFSYLNYRLNGPEFHRDLLEGRAPYTDRRVQNVLATWLWLLDQDYFQPNAIGTNSLMALMSTIRGDGGDVVSEKTAMVLAGPNFLDELPEKFRDELDFVRFPIIDPSLSVGEVVVSTGYIVPANAPRREEAMAFLQFMTSDSARAILSERLVNDHVVPAMGVENTSNLPDDLRTGISILEQADSVGVAFSLSAPLEMQGDIDRLFRRLLRTQTNDEDINIEAWLEELEAANQAQRGGQ